MTGVHVGRLSLCHSYLLVGCFIGWLSLVKGGGGVERVGRVDELTAGMYVTAFLSCDGPVITVFN